MPMYLVDRYWPAVTSCSILIPGEEVVFSVYEAPSTAALQELNERAGIPFSRIVEAVVVTGH